MNQEKITDTLGYLLHRATRGLTNRLHRNFAVAGYPITVDQWRIFSLLWESDGLCQRHMAEAIDKDKASLARTLDIMEKQSYLIRVPDQKDRRQKLVYLTKQGKQLQEKLLPIVEQTLEETRGELSETEVDTLKSLLCQIIRNLKG